MSICYVTANTLQQLTRRRNQLAHHLHTNDPATLRHMCGVLTFFNSFLQNAVQVETDADGWHHFPGEDGRLLDKGLGFRFFLPDGLALPDAVLEEALQFARKDAAPHGGFASLDGNGCFCQLCDSQLGTSLWQMIESVEQQMAYPTTFGPYRCDLEDRRTVYWGPQVCVMEPNRPWKDARDFMLDNFGEPYAPLLAVSERHLAHCHTHDGVTAANYVAGYLQKQDSPLFDGTRAGFAYDCGPELELLTEDGLLTVPTRACAMVCHPFASLEQLCDPENDSFFWSMPVPF